MKKETLYKQLIIDHYKHPLNHGVLDEYTHIADESNASCGDEVRVTIRVEDGVIEDIMFDTRGCAISVAAASLLSENLKGEQLSKLGDIEKHSLELINMSEHSGRVKCGTIAAKALIKALS